MSKGKNKKKFSTNYKRDALNKKINERQEQITNYVQQSVEMAITQQFAKTHYFLKDLLSDLLARHKNTDEKMEEILNDFQYTYFDLVTNKYVIKTKDGKFVEHFELKHNKEGKPTVEKLTYVDKAEDVKVAFKFKSAGEDQFIKNMPEDEVKEKGFEIVLVDTVKAPELEQVQNAKEEVKEELKEEAKEEKADE